MYALGAFAVLIALFMGMRALGIGPAGSLFATGKLKAKDRLVMTDFTVTNGDTSLGSVVSIAVRSALQQSSVLTILDPAVVSDALDRMERPKNTRVDVALGQGIAAREGAKAIVDGTVTAVGTGYVLTLRLLSADSAHVLASFQESGEGTRGLLQAADRVARGLRAKAGESLRSVQNAVPLARARTASIAALRLFAAGQYANAVERNSRKAVGLLQDAVRIDSSFAMAWIELTATMGNAGMPRSKSEFAATRAYLLRDRLPEGERALAEAIYYAGGPGHDRVRAMAALDRALELGVRDPDVFNNLAVRHRNRREFGIADSVYRLGIALDSTWGISQAGLIRVLEYEGRQDAADSLIAVARRRFPTNTTVRAETFGSLWNRGRLDELQRWADSAIAVRDSVNPSAPFAYAASLALLRGQLGRYREFQSRVRAIDSAAGQPASRVGAAAFRLNISAFLGVGTSADLAELEAALGSANLEAIPIVDRPDVGIAASFAWAGRPDRARVVLGQYRASIQDTAERRFREPAIANVLGLIALAEHKPTEAVSAFRRGDMASDGPVSECPICLPGDLALAFDAAGQADSAISNYEKYLGTPSWGRMARDAIRLPAAHERLGQLYEAKGNIAKAAEHYRAFIELWKNADPELQPRVTGARRRLQMLGPFEKSR